MRNRENWGFIFLAIFLILEGLVRLTSGDAVSIILGILALAAGIFILMANVSVGTRTKSKR